MSSLFDVRKQLVFYGSYHANTVNVRIHMLFVPIIMWTVQVMLCTLPTPAFFPTYRHDFNSLLSFQVNWGLVMSIVYLSYYIALLPSAALSYAPQMALFYLFANAVSHNPDYVKLAMVLHVSSWVAQIYGHQVHEGRAPALLDNLVGALVLAPFFVHLEVLFGLGLYSDFHRQINNGIGVEIAKYRREIAAKKRNA